MYIEKMSAEGDRFSPREARVSVERGARFTLTQIKVLCVA